MNNQAISIVTIDGPSGAGKGTVCSLLAKNLGWHLLDSGAIYRVFAIAASELNLKPEQTESLVQLAESLDLTFEVQDDLVSVLLNGVDISLEVRKETTGNLASQFAVIPEVRTALLHRQQMFAKAPGLIADGRDMGTVVFPNATIKIFLDASAEERARRRQFQLQQKGINANFDNLLHEIQERDFRDRNRAVAPLKPAEDAIVIDSTSMSIQEVFEFVMVKIQEKI